MHENTCPVTSMQEDIGRLIRSGEFVQPKDRRLAEEIFELIRDVSFGRAGSRHLSAILELLYELASKSDSRQTKEQATGLVKNFQAALEVFESHINTRNCATGDCLRLAPAPCQMTCPAGIDIPTYITLAGQGRYDEAVEVIRKDCPFPWVCGLVCTRPCEFMCVRKRIDDPVSIKAIKAFVAEKALSEGNYKNPEPLPANGKKVCIIGAGPGGMSAAYYLALKGYKVEIFEAHAYAGGMLLLGIPRYRLPREVIEREVNMLRELGVVFHFNTHFGSDITYNELKKEGFDAFFLAIGAHRCYDLGVPNEDQYPDQKFKAIRLLRRVALGNLEKPGDRVVVVGGGNVAIDAARTCLRLGSREVTIAYRRTRAEMPADHEEIEQAEEEGIRFDFLNIPIGLEGDGKRLTGLRSLRAELARVEGQNRKFPRPIPGSEFVIPADALVVAIGQIVDVGVLSSVEGLDYTRRKTIRSNTVTMETSVPGVFAAGDAVSGPATVIEAIGGGKRAAESIDRYLCGLPRAKMPPVPVRRGKISPIPLTAGKKMLLKRPVMPVLNIDRRRTTFQQVELGYTETEIHDEACRCLRCDICLRCGRCVEICRDRMGINALKIGYFDFDHPVKTDFRITAELCILCGACAANCPTGAMQINDRDNERILSLCGTVLNREKLVHCRECGKVIGTDKYLDFIRSRTSSVARVVTMRFLCDVCAKKSATTFNVGD